MKRNVQFLGIVSLIAIVFAFVTWGILAQDNYHLVQIHVGVALLSALLFVCSGGVHLLGSKTAKRVAGFGFSVATYSALFVAVLVLINYLAARHVWFHYDSTEQKVYTLAPQTIQVLENLPAELQIRAFYLGGTVDDPKTKDLLSRIEKASSRVSLSIIDPEKNPTVVEKYNIKENKTVSLVLKLPDGDKETKISHTITEQELVTAILRITKTASKTIYYVVGHGEPDLNSDEQAAYSSLRDAVKDETYLLKELTLGPTGNIPSDAAAIILAAPEKPLLPEEIKTIEAYLTHGGRAILLHQPRMTDDIALIAASLGITVGKDVVVDQVIRPFEGPALGVQPMITSYYPHAITKGFKEGVLFGVTSSVQKGKVPAGAKVTELAMTGSHSWAEKKIDLIFGDNPQASFEEEDIKGPVSVAAVYENPAEGQNVNAANGSRVVVFGDADFVNNVTIRQLFNRDLFLNALNWVVGEESGVTIRSGTMRASTKSLSADQFYKMFLFGAILAPELLLLCGLAVWWLRQNAAE